MSRLARAPVHLVACLLPLVVATESHAQESRACIADVPAGYARLDDVVRRQWRGGITFSDVETGQLILVGFEKDEDALRPEHEGALSELAGRLTGPDVSDYTIRRLVGGASQTGPEPDNVDLSEARAERVAQTLLRAGVDVEEYEYFGSSRPYNDLPGEECAVNRYVVVQYDLCRSAEQPIRREALEEFVTGDFEALKQLAEIPDDRRPIVPDMEMSIRRCDAKTRYLLGRSYDRLEQALGSNKLAPPAKTPAYTAFGFRYQSRGNRPQSACRGSATEHTRAKVLLEESRNTWLREAYSQAAVEAGDLFKETLAISRGALWHAPAYRDRLLAEHHERCREDIYFRYTYCGPESYSAEDGSTRYRWPAEWRAEADALERRVFGDVTDCQLSEDWWDALWRKR